MRDIIEDFDRSIFLMLNGMHTDLLDSFMYLISHKLFWLPLYVLFFFLIQQKFGWKRLGYFALGIGITVLLSDQISSSIFKPFFGRARPCNNIDLIDIVHTVRGRCGSGFSFVSGHATNFFAVAVFASNALGRGKYRVVLLLWAALIAYSRVYLGVHYPADITAGALLGLLIGYLVYKGYEKVLSRQEKL